MTKDGYNDGGEPLIHSTFKDFGGEAYHQHYPMQMFDRKLRPMDTLYVGLVCTKRVMDEQSRDRLVRQTPALRQKRDDHARANPSDSEAQANEAALPATVQSFYTFHFAPFSSNQAWLPSATADYNPYTGDYDGVEEVRVHELGYAEPSAKKAKKHYEEAKRGETYDPYIGPARREFEGMVGAWRIGKGLDTSGQKRDQYTGGPVDTTTAVTVNVCLEFMDWRALRRSFDRADIGMRAPGARPWIDEGKIGNVRAEEERRRLRDNDTTPVSAFEAQRIALNRPLSSFAPMPTRVDLEGRQSQEGNGHTAPAPGSLARVKWDAWLTFLYTQNRQLALQRIDTNARAMDAAAYSAEIDALVESMASMTDDGRIMQWPTTYIALTDDELAHIRTEATSGDRTRQRDAYVTSQARGSGERDADVDARDNLRFKMVHNMPMNLRRYQELRDLIGQNERDWAVDGEGGTWRDSVLVGPGIFSRGGYDPLTGRYIGPMSLNGWGEQVDAERQQNIRDDAYRRDGYGYMPSNRTPAGPYRSRVPSDYVPNADPSLNLHDAPPRGLHVYAHYPTTYTGRTSALPGTAEYDRATAGMTPEEVGAYDMSMYRLVVGADANGDLNGDRPLPGFEPGQKDQQELHDLMNDELKQWQFYKTDMQMARNLRVAGYGNGFRARVLNVRRRQKLDSYASGDRVKNAIDALWTSLQTFANNKRRAQNAPVGVEEWIDWLRAPEAATGLDLAGGFINGTVIPNGVLSTDTIDAALAAAGGPINAPRTRPAALDTLAVLPGNSLMPTTEWRQAVARREANFGGFTAADEALQHAIMDWQLMSMLDNVPGISHDDFIDYYAPRTIEEFRDAQGRKLFLRGDANERFLELIESPVGNDRLSMAALARLHAADGIVLPAVAAPPATGASSSVADVVMADAPAAGRSAGKAPVRRRAPPVQPASKSTGKSAGSATPSVPEHAPAAPAVATSPSLSAVASLSATASATADLAAAVARSGRSPGSSPQHSPSLAAPTSALAAGAATATPAEPAAAAASGRVGGRQRRSADGSASASSAQTANVFASIFGGGAAASASSGAAPAAPAPAPAPATTGAAVDPTPSPSAGSEDGASTGTGSSGGRQRVRRPRDGAGR